MRACLNLRLTLCRRRLRRLSPRSSAVVAPPHDISPPLDEQLVLELEARVAVNEAVGVFPGGRCVGLPLPVYQELANASGQAGTDDALWFRNGGAIVDRRQAWWCSRRRAYEALQEADVEDVVKASARRQLELVGHLIDDGDDAVRAVVARSELA